MLLKQTEMGRAMAAAAAAPKPVCPRHCYRPAAPPRIMPRLQLWVVARSETLQGGAAATSQHSAVEQQQQQQRQQQVAVEQQQQDQQEQPDAAQQGVKENHTKARIRRNVKGWTDPSTPNTGIVSITRKSRLHGAAACVAADLETRRLTRIVPATGEEMHGAITTVRLAGSIVQQQQQAAAAAAAAAPEATPSDEAKVEAQAEAAEPRSSRSTKPVVLAFQPVQVVKELAAPPLLPAGATALYVSPLRKQAKHLQDALSRRAASIAAAAAAATAAGPEGQEAAPLPSSGPQQVNMTSNSDPAIVASVLNKALCEHGWSELVCLGRQEEGLPTAMQALVKLRRMRYGFYKEDAAALILGDTAVLGEAGQSLPGFKSGTREQPTSFLLLRCAKNTVTKLLPVEPNGAAVVTGRGAGVEGGDAAVEGASS